MLIFNTTSVYYTILYYTTVSYILSCIMYTMLYFTVLYNNYYIVSYTIYTIHTLSLLRTEHRLLYREAQKRERARQLELASAGQKQLRGRLQDKRVRAKEQLLGTTLYFSVISCKLTLNFCSMVIFFMSFIYIFI